MSWASDEDHHLIKKNSQTKMKQYREMHVIENERRSKQGN